MQFPLWRSRSITHPITSTTSSAGSGCSASCRSSTASSMGRAATWRSRRGCRYIRSRSFHQHRPQRSQSHRRVSMSLSTLEEFVAYWTVPGRICDFDGAYGTQCVDPADFYLRDVWGIAPFFVTGAVDLFGHRPDLIEWITNDAGNPNQFPQPGDMVIWGLDAKIGTGVNGHVDIFLEGDGNNFKGLD